MPKGSNNKFRKNKTLEEIYGIMKAKEIKEKIRKKKIGHFHSEETKRKISETLKKLYKEGKRNSWIKGHKFNGLPCPKCGKTHPDHTGKNNPASREKIKKKIGEGNRKYPVVEKICQNCGKKFIAKGKNSLIRKYCSQECWWHSKEHAGMARNVSFLGGKKAGEVIRKLHKGKTYEEIFGEEKAKEIKEKQREWTKLHNPMRYVVDRVAFGRKVSESLKRSEKLKGENNPSFGKVRYPKLHYVQGLDHKVRSSIEEKFCLFLKRNRILYEYEPTYFKLHSNGTMHSYTPDLKIKDVYLELKQFIFEQDWKKIILFREQYPTIKYFVITDNKKIIDRCSKIDVNVIQVDKNFENLDKILPTLKTILGEAIGEIS
jgi:hypothetical protein